MKKCPGCGRLFHDDVDKCSVDGQALIAVSTEERAQILKRRNSPPQSYSTRQGSSSIAQRHFIVGALWLVGGIAVTAFTYSAASGSGGGTYVVAWGAVLVGVTRLIRGFVASSQTRGQSISYNTISTIRSTAPTEKPVWTCPKCGEQSLPQTTSCWKCGAQRTATP